MARTLKTQNTEAQTETTATAKVSSAELNQRRHMALNSLRKRGVEFNEGFEAQHTLANIAESIYYKHANGLLTDEEASKALDDAVQRHKEGYDPLKNPKLL